MQMTTIAGIVGILLMLILMFAGVNLAFSFFISGFIGVVMILGFGGGLTYLQTIPVTTAMSYSLAVLPMFMLMGDFAVMGALTTDAYGAARKWFGRLPGGLAITSTVASAIFGAICGSGQATAMVMSQVAWPEMKRYGYEPKLGLCSIAAAGPLAILIPPSTPIIIYGILAQTSVGKLFMAGWLPGILLTLLLCITTAVLFKLRPAWAPRAEKTTLTEKLRSLKAAWPILLLVVFIMVCIWGGITTVNEAAGISVIVCLIIVICKHRAGGKKILQTLKESAVQASGLFFMFIGIQLFNAFMGLSKLPAMLSSWVTGLALPPMAIIWVIVIIYLVLGCFIDTPVIMMLTIPLFAPAVSALGFDLVWFGILSTMCVALGSITPPVGICLFVIGARVKEVPLITLMKGVWPYVIATFAATVLVMYIPQLSLLLPSLMS